MTDPNDPRPSFNGSRRGRWNSEISELRATVRELEDRHSQLVIERDRLRKVLREAHELALEGWSYASDYFRQKWSADRRLDEVAAALSDLSESSDSTKGKEHG